MPQNDHLIPQLFSDQYSCPSLPESSIHGGPVSWSVQLWQPQPSNVLFKRCNVSLRCKQSSRLRIACSKACKSVEEGHHYSVIFEAFAGKPGGGVPESMWWCIVLCKDHGLLNAADLFQKLVEGLGDAFQSIFSLERSNKLWTHPSGPSRVSLI